MSEEMKALKRIAQSILYISESNMTGTEIRISLILVELKICQWNVDDNTRYLLLTDFGKSIQI